MITNRMVETKNTAKMDPIINIKISMIDKIIILIAHKIILTKMQTKIIMKIKIRWIKIVIIVKKMVILQEIVQTLRKREMIEEILAVEMIIMVRIWPEIILMTIKMESVLREILQMIKINGMKFSSLIAATALVTSS